MAAPEVPADASRAVPLPDRSRSYENFIPQENAPHGLACPPPMNRQRLESYDNDLGRPSTGQSIASSEFDNTEDEAIIAPLVAPARPEPEDVTSMRTIAISRADDTASGTKFAFSFAKPANSPRQSPREAGKPGPASRSQKAEWQQNVQSLPTHEFSHLPTIGRPEHVVPERVVSQTVDLTRSPRPLSKKATRPASTGPSTSIAKAHQIGDVMGATSTSTPDGPPQSRVEQYGAQQHYLPEPGDSETRWTEAQEYVNILAYKLDQGRLTAAAELESEREAFKCRLSAAEHDYRALHRSYEDNQRQNHQLAKALEEEKRKFETCKKKIFGFKTFVDGLGRDIDSLRKDATLTRRACDQLRHDSDTTKATHADLLNNLSASADKTAMLQKDALEVCGEYQLQLREAEARIVRLEKALSDNAGLLAEERDRRSDAERRLLDIRSSATESEQSLQLSNTFILNKLSEIQTALAQSASNQETSEVAKMTFAAVQTLTSQHTSTAGEVDSVRALIEKLADVAAHASSASDEAGRHADQSDTPILESLQSLRSELVERAEWAEQASTDRTTIVALEKRLETAEQRCTIATSDMSTARAHEARLSATNATLEAKVTALQNSMSTLQDSAACLTSTKADLISQSKALSAAMDEVRDKSAQLQALQSSNIALQARFDSLQVDLTRLRDEPAGPSFQQAVDSRVEACRLEIAANAKKAAIEHQSVAMQRLRELEAQKATANRVIVEKDEELNSTKAAVESLQTRIDILETSLRTAPHPDASKNSEEVEADLQAQIESMQKDLARADEKMRQRTAADEKFRLDVQRSWEAEQTQHRAHQQKLQEQVKRLEEENALLQRSSQRTEKARTEEALCSSESGHSTHLSSQQSKQSSSMPNQDRGVEEHGTEALKRPSTADDIADACSAFIADEDSFIHHAESTQLPCSAKETADETQVVEDSLNLDATVASLTQEQEGIRSAQSSQQLRSFASFNERLERHPASPRRLMDTSSLASSLLRQRTIQPNSMTQTGTMIVPDSLPLRSRPDASSPLGPPSSSQDHGGVQPGHLSKHWPMPNIASKMIPRNAASDAHLSSPSHHGSRGDTINGDASTERILNSSGSSVRSQTPLAGRLSTADQSNSPTFVSDTAKMRHSSAARGRSPIVYTSRHGTHTASKDPRLINRAESHAGKGQAKRSATTALDLESRKRIKSDANATLPGSHRYSLRKPQTVSDVPTLQATPRSRTSQTHSLRKMGQPANKSRQSRGSSSKDDFRARFSQELA